ncbi:hypothetical protein [Flavobacterium sp. fv08]|uniref:hypothetical protein n=1 Tax=Flavobacterium sp. fv08 TaxID=1761784 RepID=UPI0008C6F370|nr:hypothetical protein [Flavobacterium sp. fv08]SEP06628.1 hypothetical protein SAMN04487978_4367 [Flavobacterium sp. fv08]
MKNLPLIFVLLIGGACTTDTVEESYANDIAKKTGSADSVVSNSLNPYDHIGESYLALLDHYHSTDPKPEIPIEVLALLETIGEDMNILTSDYNPVSLPTVSNADQYTDYSQAVAELGLSIQAQDLLITCIEGLLDLKQQDATYEEAYVYLVSFESAVSASSLSSEEKEILLSTLSIVRYDIYNSSGRKKKDRDWELSVGSFIATTEAAEESLPNAIIIAGMSSILN